MKEKKVSYTRPQLTTHGQVEIITLGGNKDFGVGDDFTFQNQSTMVTS